MLSYLHVPRGCSIQAECCMHAAAAQDCQWLILTIYPPASVLLQLSDASLLLPLMLLLLLVPQTMLAQQADGAAAGGSGRMQLVSRHPCQHPVQCSVILMLCQQMCCVTASAACTCLLTWHVVLGACSSHVALTVSM